MVIFIIYLIAWVLAPDVKEAARNALRNPVHNQKELEKAYQGVAVINDGEAVLLAEKLKKRLGL